MQDSNSAGISDNQDLPEAKVRRRRWPSAVWLIPLTAALIGAWLLYQYWFQRGDIITVRFPSAEGIQPGSTQVRFKALTVGKVKNVTLDENLETLVTLALNKEISDVLDCSAQFWIVRPRIQGTEISGLGTLFSGTYVGMMPRNEEAETGEDEPSLLCYQGLDRPPLRKPDRPGREFKLLADSVGSLDVGTPVFYKQLKAGEIINYRFVPEKGQVELSIFVDEPYYQFVNDNTRFWNSSGVDFKLTATGVEFHMEPLTYLLTGSISFDTPSDVFEDLPISTEGEQFNLYEDYASSLERRYEERLYYTLYFNGSLRGLSESAPVEFRGIRVGQVEKVQMILDEEAGNIRIPVLVSVEPGRFAEGISSTEAPKLMSRLVGQGMRAKLESGNLLTGQKYVALVFEKNPESATIAQGQFYDVFPTTATSVEELSRMASGIADDLKVTLAEIRKFAESNQLDKTFDNVNSVLEETEQTIVEARSAITAARQVMLTVDEQTLPRLSQNVDEVANTVNQSLTSVTGNVGSVSANLNRSLSSVTGNVGEVSANINRSLTSVTGNIGQVSASADRAMQTLTGQVVQAGDDFTKTTQSLNQAMVRLQNSLTHLDRLLARNSPTQHQLAEMLKEVSAMSRSVRVLADTLWAQPESLIRGKQ